MCEFHTHHIEANSACNCFSFRYEIKARATINETFDVPDRRQTINEQVATSIPSPPLVLFKGQCRPLAPKAFRTPMVSVLRSSENFLASIESCLCRRVTG